MEIGYFVLGFALGALVGLIRIVWIEKQLDEAHERFQEAHENFQELAQINDHVVQVNHRCIKIASANTQEYIQELQKNWDYDKDNTTLH